MARKTKGLEYDSASIFPNKKCLSSSQVILILEDVGRFHEEHVIGIKKPASQAMNIGKVFSAMYEDRSFNWKKALQDFGVTNARIYRALEKAIAQFPVIPKRMCEYPLKCKYRGWEFRATLDGYFDNRIDIENKTGMQEWTQERADESVQVTFQYWVKFIKDKELFEECQLNWVDLRATATQLVVPFKTYRTIEQISEFQLEIDKALDILEENGWADLVK